MMAPSTMDGSLQTRRRDSRRRLRRAGHRPEATMLAPSPAEREIR